MKQAESKIKDEIIPALEGVLEEIEKVKGMDILKTNLHRLDIVNLHIIEAKDILNVVAEFDAAYNPDDDSPAYVPPNRPIEYNKL